MIKGRTKCNKNDWIVRKDRERERERIEEKSDMAQHNTKQAYEQEQPSYKNVNNSHFRLGHGNSFK